MVGYQLNLATNSKMIKKVRALYQWLSTFFVLVHTLRFARKPVHLCPAVKFSAVKV